ncbi:Translation initiation factor [Boothiomyces sp. JEL0838]|nr:Translation initiation factor [Boothiomyces sp. JEL0838]
MFNIKRVVDEIEKACPTMALPVVTVQALVEFTKQSNASTFAEYMVCFANIVQFKRTNKNAEKTWTKAHQVNSSYTAGTDLFKLFVTNTSISTNFDSFKNDIIEGGEIMIRNSNLYRQQAAEKGMTFIRDNSTILVHSYSRLVMLLLEMASKEKNFKVYVTQASPSSAGLKAVQELRRLNVEAALIADAAIGYIMEKVDMVLVGAEGVVRNGGVINQIGTFPIGVVAKAAGKPFYCVAESYKFVDVFPLNQDDLEFASLAPSYFTDEEDNGKCLISNPIVDYTPPNLVTMFFTNEGILTPSGVSELMLKSDKSH